MECMHSFLTELDKHFVFLLCSLLHFDYFSHFKVTSGLILLNKKRDPSASELLRRHAVSGFFNLKRQVIFILGPSCVVMVN